VLAQPAAPSASATKSTFLVIVLAFVLVQNDIHYRYAANAAPPFERLSSTKRAGVVECPRVFDHAGLLVIGPLGKAGLPFI
jgi:hypothetical protein